MSCYATGRATALLSWLDVDRLQHDTSMIYFLTSNLIQLNRTAVAETKHKNKETVGQTFKCILMYL